MDTTTLDRLRIHWHHLLGDQAGSPHGSAALADLLARYQHPDRHYHNPDHILNMLTWLTMQPLQATVLLPLGLAVWFHDAVYDTHAADNEQQSADLARIALGRLDLQAGLIDDVVRLILLTRTHATSPEDRAGVLLLDADLAILGAEPANYDAYAAAIRREYSWVPDKDYRSGRLGVLSGFLRRPQIYHTAEGFQAWEKQARINLERESIGLGVITEKK